MYYAKIKDVSHDEAVTIINDHLAFKNLKLRDLVTMINYPLPSKGLRQLESFFQDGDNASERQVRQKIGEALGINHELLHGERKFESREEYCRFVFKPYLERIPTNTIPSQIIMFGFVGYSRVFVVGKYAEILHKPLGEQLEFIKDMAISDTQERSFVPFFGKKLGYALYYDYEKPAIPISLQGELLDDMNIGYCECSCSVSMRSKNIAEEGRFRIPRLVPIEAKGEV